MGTVLGSAEIGRQQSTGLAGAILLLDGWTYFWHWANHRVPFLWRFHRVHHSDSEMDVTTAARFHFGEIVISSLLRIPLIVAFGIRLSDLVLYETILFVVVQFHHANISLPASLDHALRLLIVTPSMHKIHHSRVAIETNSNYTSFLSIWDRLFRTINLSRDPHDVKFGLDRLDRPKDHHVGGLLLRPLGSTRS